MVDRRAPAVLSRAPLENDTCGLGRRPTAVVDHRRQRDQSEELAAALEAEKTSMKIDVRRHDDPNWTASHAMPGAMQRAARHRASRDGFGGIGVRINAWSSTRASTILSVMEKTPAEAAGALQDERRDRRPSTASAAAGLSQREVVRKLRGPMRSKVTLPVHRAKRRTRPAADRGDVRAHIVPQTVEVPQPMTATSATSRFRASTRAPRAPCARRSALAQAARSAGKPLGVSSSTCAAIRAACWIKAVCSCPICSWTVDAFSPPKAGIPDSHQYVRRRG